jgi:L-ribulose-5-phosphate 4-epimerase
MDNKEQKQRIKMKKLIEAVWLANLKLKNAGLVPLTWGNVSQIDRSAGLIAIKPSGVAYENMKKEDMVLVDSHGKLIASRRRPSSDLPSHLVLYLSLPTVGAVVHTHSVYATAFAQANMAVPCLGTTHADYCLGEIPVTDKMTPAQIRSDYEKNTGEIIVKKMRLDKLLPERCPFILVAGHGPFAWGKNADEAVENAVVLEYLCKMALMIYILKGKLKPISRFLLNKHFFRKHGPHAYYGQKNG